MSAPHRLPEMPAQVLPREAYVSATWLDRERRDLFSRSWTLAGVTTDFSAPGDYRTVQAGLYPLIVMRDRDGELRAFHNLCRHRGTELLEGNGNAGNAIPVSRAMPTSGRKRVMTSSRC